MSSSQDFKDSVARAAPNVDFALANKGMAMIAEAVRSKQGDPMAEFAKLLDRLAEERKIADGSNSVEEAARIALQPLAKDGNGRWIIDQALVDGFLSSEPSNLVDQHVQAFIENCRFSQGVDARVIREMAKDTVAAKEDKIKVAKAFSEAIAMFTEMKERLG